MKLRPYHNPENFDESSVPDGHRMRYEDEMTTVAHNALWFLHGEWTESISGGKLPNITYIVPVA